MFMVVMKKLGRNPGLFLFEIVPQYKRDRN